MDGKQLEIGNSKFMNQQGYFYQRVADIGTAVYVAVDGEYAGYILITDVVRKEAGRLLKWLKKQQIEAVMITGDNERVAEDVARQLKLDYVYAGLMPEEKVEQVREFMESHMEDEKLAFVGDGINDAPFYYATYGGEFLHMRISGLPWGDWARMQLWRQRISF